jgi:transposase
LLKACPWLSLRSLAGLSQLLSRLKIRWKRARWHVHSPDTNYVEKLHHIWVQIRAVQIPEEQWVLLFEDEFTLYRHPSLVQAFEQAGKIQPLAELGYLGNYTWRIAAAIHLWTGAVTYHQARAMDVTRMILFYRKLFQAYPGAEILLVEDNWPIHYHPDLLATLQPQPFPYGLRVSPRWPKQPTRPIPKDLLPIRLLFLPTYAPWTNPIEKLWRLLKHEVLHLHRYVDDWPALKQRVFSFLDEFRNGSKDLLRYVGLEDPLRLYRAIFPA